MSWRQCWSWDEACKGQQSLLIRLLAPAPKLSNLQTLKELEIWNINCSHNSELVSVCELQWSGIVSWRQCWSWDEASKGHQSLLIGLWTPTPKLSNLQTWKILETWKINWFHNSGLASVKLTVTSLELISVAAYWEPPPATDMYSLLGLSGEVNSPSKPASPLCLHMQWSFYWFSITPTMWLLVVFKLAICLLQPISGIFHCELFESPPPYSKEDTCTKQSPIPTFSHQVTVIEAISASPNIATCM